MIISHVKQLMEQQGKTLRDFAMEAGVSRQTLIRARENAFFESCSIGTLKKIAQALEVEVKDLFSEVKDARPKM